MIGNPLNGFASNHFQNGKIGIIGLDTSHSVAFTKALNGTSAQRFKIVAAYPNGSADIESSVKRIPGYTEEVKKYGVEIVGSIAELLSKVDFVCLETNDGRPHLQQALEVFKAGKPVFLTSQSQHLSQIRLPYMSWQNNTRSRFFQAPLCVIWKQPNRLPKEKLEKYRALIVSVRLPSKQHIQIYSGTAFTALSCCIQ